MILFFFFWPDHPPLLEIDFKDVDGVLICDKLLLQLRVSWPLCLQICRFLWWWPKKRTQREEEQRQNVKKEVIFFCTLQFFCSFAHTDSKHHSLILLHVYTYNIHKDMLYWLVLRARVGIHPLLWRSYHM